MYVTLVLSSFQQVCQRAGLRRRLCTVCPLQGRNHTCRAVCRAIERRLRFQQVLPRVELQVKDNMHERHAALRLPFLKDSHATGLILKEVCRPVSRQQVIKSRIQYVHAVRGQPALKLEVTVCLYGPTTCFVHRPAYPVSKTKSTYSVLKFTGKHIWQPKL